MKLKTRLILLGLCVVAFLIVAPYIVLYSLGYRVDVTNLTIRGTGGIYVYAQPDPQSITIDNAPASPTGYFSSAVFMQNLMPGAHTVIIKKDGYQSYQKKLMVAEKQVTKLENVTLFKQTIPFTLLAALPGKNTSITNLAWSPDGTKGVANVAGTYYLVDVSAAKPSPTPLPLLAGASQVNFDPASPSRFFFIKNANLYSTAQTAPLQKNVLTYLVNNQTVTWLAADGFLYQSDAASIVPAKITTMAFAVKPTANYQLISAEGITFLQSRTDVFKLNTASQTLELFSSNITKLIASPDNQRIAYASGNQILLSTAAKNHRDIAQLDTYASPITDVYWVNSSYLVIASGDSITISEIDARGNINKITLPPYKSPQIFFRQQDKKLYIFSGQNLVASERLVP